MTKHNCLSLFPFTRIALPSLKCFLLPFSIPLGLGIIFSYPSDAQVANYGRSPSLNILTTPGGTGASSYSFAPSNGWTCPTPGLSIGAYGGGGNDWSNDFTTHNSAGSGINNYGIAAGITVPFGGDFSKYCNDYAKSVAERTRMEMEAVRRNNQLTLLTQCYWLFQNRINTDQPAFKDNGAFSSLSACGSYDPQSIQGGENTSTPQRLESPKPPVTEIIPQPASNLIIQQK
ncbi:MAG: hypothetical protein ACOVOV_14650 [Dolichospermum sp.]|jgi:hypothetical protein|uniref:Uncharacterized protein n=1 Tax=Microcystis aeruginosa KW TaxID=1960155 RepID=A0A1V4BLS2_MICAE|nr:MULTISPECIES: hypothetical protein [Microcystis]MCA6605599.1 hypothetical protein [Pseudanabaena sp. M007S1SP1A06QC]MCA2666058.1 hypothetical protein [Microcystis sp. M045S2]MCA2805102.1 hypothetical protein [Microcystis sp. M114S2]MCA2837257.1 hypothetical protein [Microcystis sp. M078S1]MCA2848136.1 hypothetical protein [Microcystis sp. M074S1]